MNSLLVRPWVHHSLIHVVSSPFLTILLGSCEIYELIIVHPLMVHVAHWQAAPSCYWQQHGLEAWQLESATLMLTTKLLKAVDMERSVATDR